MEPILNRTILPLKSNDQGELIVDRGVLMRNLSLKVEVPDSLLGHNLWVRFDNLLKTHHWGIKALALEEKYIIINPADDWNLGPVDWPAHKISFKLLNGAAGTIGVSSHEKEHMS